MTAATQDFPAFEPQMKGPLVASAVLHVVLVVIAIVGLPYLKPELPVIDTSITVELMDAADMPEDKPEKPVEPRPKPPEQKAEEPPRPVMPKVTATTPPKPVAPKPPEKTEEIAPPEKDPTPIKKPEPPKEQVKTPPKPVQRPVLTKAEEPPQEEEFKSVLRNLIAEPQEPVKTDTPGDAKTAPATGQPMSMSEMGALKAQLSQCWSVMAGARYAEDLVVDLRIFVNPDRTVRDVKIENQLRYNADSYYRAAADSALRAVFRCSPLDLPPNKYDQWKIIIVSFDPRTML